MDKLKAALESSKAIIQKIHEAAEKRNIGELFKAGREFIRETVFAVQQLSLELEKSGDHLEGADKKDIVKNAVKSVITPKVNAALDIPFLNEQQEAALIDGLIDHTIEKAVKEFKKRGWAQ